MKTYWLSPGDSSIFPSAYSGLTPTMSLFVDNAGATVLGPAITEAVPGSGAYMFTYGPTIGMFFTVDWGVSVPSIYRYTKGGLDPIQAVDEHVGGIINNDDSFGDATTQPTTVIGFLKRLQELGEGDATFDKATATWTIMSRGASVILRVKELTNTVSEATKF